MPSAKVFQFVNQIPGPFLGDAFGKQHAVNQQAKLCIIKLPPAQESALVVRYNIVAHLF